jgi:thiamine biosynthesis lipoprotein
MTALWPVAVAAAPSTALTRFERAQIHMGTQFRVTLYATVEAVATKGLDAAFARIAQLDNALSDYDDASELTALSRSAGGEAKPVSDDLFEVLDRALELSRRTDGAFDVTAGPLVRQWRRARRLRRAPTPEQIADAKRKVGYQKILLDRDKRTARLIEPGMLLDLGGIAKGFACDKALAALRQHGVERAMVVGGGDVALGDPPPGLAGWTASIVGFPNAAGPPIERLALRRSAISTSGDAEQFIELNGRRYSHIVDPETGIGVEGRFQATVIAPDGTATDALASAMCILGPDRGWKALDGVPGSAGLYVRLANDRIECSRSPRWSSIAAPATE